MSYPRWMYSADGAVLLRSPAEEDALVGAWFDSPAKVPMPKEEGDQPEDGTGDLTDTQDDAAGQPAPRRGRPRKVSQ